MKTIVFVLLSLLNALIAYSQKRQLKREVAVTTNYYYENGKEKSSDRLEYYEKYDRQGHEIEYATYGEVTESAVTTGGGGVAIGDDFDYLNIFASWFTTYDNNGRQLRAETWLFHNNQKSELFDYTKFQYNHQGLLVKEIKYSPKNTVDKTVSYTYDKSGNNTRIIDSDYTFDRSLKVSVDSTENQFDTLNRLISSTEYSNGKFLLRKKFIYAGDIEIELRYDDDPGKLWAETETTYRSPGQPGTAALVSENCQQITDKDGLFEKDELYIRDSNGLLKQIKTYINGDLMSVTRFIHRFY
jgi:hypothetical protein